MEVSIVPMTPVTIPIYIEVGIRAYDQHYLHLWKNEDSSPYINSSFTKKVLKNELRDSNNAHYIVFLKGVPVGILKLIINCACPGYSGTEALLAQKIYILNEYSGKGIGRATLNFIKLQALNYSKKVIWLDTMKKGPAYFFYLKNGFRIIGTIQLALPMAIESERDMYQMLLPLASSKQN